VANGSAIATEAIPHIGALYDIEREIRSKPAGLRCEVRQTRARPLVDELQRWFNKTLAGLSRKSDTAAAIRYALSRWRALIRYLDDGQIEMDNSAAERALRTVALGRKAISLRAPMPAENALLQSTTWLERPNSMDSTRNSISGTSYSALPTTPSIASRSSCPGTSPAYYQTL
jgi:hypothetical protein